MSDNNRKDVRIQSEQFISYTLFDHDEKVCDEGMGVARDVSRNGMALESRRSMEVGYRIDLSIALGEEVLQTEGIVRNVKEPGESGYLIGIEFKNISKEEIEKLVKQFPNINRKS